MENPFKIPDLSSIGNIFKHSEVKIPDFNVLEFNDPHEVTNKILTFLQSQSEIAERQFKTSRNLIIATIIIMSLQIFIAIITTNQSNYRQNNLTTIIETQAQQSEIISRMSLNLLDLQNQVQTLEQENESLLKQTP